MSTQNVISLRGVGKTYGGFRVLSGIDMEVNQGEIVALLGQTGAGKSTVMNMIMGTQPTSEGTVRVAGHDPYAEFQALRGKLAVSFQTDRLLPWRTAVENCELGLLILKVPAAEARKRALTWLARVKLDAAADKYPHELSGGMRQRVSLARALCVDPKLVLLDESFSQLDHVTSRTLRQDFAKVVREYQKTCLFVTHRIDDAIEMADRVIVLRPGVGVALHESIPAETRTNPALATALHDRIADCMGGDAAEA